MTPNVVFGIASYSGSVCHEFHGSLTETLGALGRAGIPCSTITAAGDPYLSKARNRLVSDFLLHNPHASHLFFLDDDIGWPGHKVVEFVQRDLDMIGGIYPKKSDMPQWPMQLQTDADGLPIERAGLYRALLAPTGFLCIARRVLERMAAASEQYRDTTHPTAPPLHWNVFDMGWFMPDGSSARAAGKMGEFWGEDYYFCRRWRDMSGEIWIDPDIQFTHRGSKAWPGSFKPALDAWAEQQSVQARAAAADIARRVEEARVAGERAGAERERAVQQAAFAAEREKIALEARALALAESQASIVRKPPRPRKRAAAPALQAAD